MRFRHTGPSSTVRLPHDAELGVELCSEALVSVLGNFSNEEGASQLRRVFCRSLAAGTDRGSDEVTLSINVTVEGLHAILPVVVGRVDRHLLLEAEIASQVIQEVVSPFAIVASVLATSPSGSAATRCSAEAIDQVDEVRLNLEKFFRGKLLRRSFLDLGHRSELRITVRASKSGEGVRFGEAIDCNGDGAVWAISDKGPIVDLAWGGEVHLNSEVGSLASTQVDCGLRGVGESEVAP